MRILERMGRPGSRARTWRAAGLAAVAAVVSVGASAPAATAIEFEQLSASFVDASGAPVRQAGAHPNVRVDFRAVRANPASPASYTQEPIRSFRLELPPGVVGNPTGVGECSEEDLKSAFSGNAALCPLEAQIGFVRVASGPINYNMPIYNLERPADSPGQFAFNFLGVIVKMIPEVRAGDYGITVDSGLLSIGATFNGATAILWGVPADSANNFARIQSGKTLACSSVTTCSNGGAISTAARRPFLSLPTSCQPEPLSFTGYLDGWRTPGEIDIRTITSDLNSVPFTLTGCDALAFAPEASVLPTSRATDSPAGVEVDLRVPQNDAPNALATAHVKDVRMTLPEGLAVSPGSAVGLGACSPQQIELSSNGPHSCPASSKLGTVTVETPLLDSPLSGEVILATPDDNPFGSLIALYIVAEGSGVRVKLPGEVRADPATGQLTATFENNPQLPFSRLKVRFDGGDNGSLATPNVCGRYETQTALASWSGKSVDLVSPMVVDEGCGPRGFSPSFVAGTENPVAGGSSAFSLAIGRADRTEELSTLESLKLPKGLLGYVSRVPLCGDGAADAGVCDVGSRIGHVQVSAGPGGSPVWVPQQGKAPTSVSLAGPYKGAPYSLSVVVPAQAGPFDLGRVVVRSPLHLDRVTAQLSTNIDVSRVYDRKGNLTQTIEGAMPTIVEGIPLRVRDLRVVVDREDFTVNPTSCAPSRIDATLKSVGGQSAAVGSRFQVGECASLAFTPNLGMRLIGKGRTRTGAHPGLSATLRQAEGQANIAKARVTLPKSVVLDPSNSTDPALVCDYDKGLAADCPASSIIGKATARTPLLGKPLTGNVHLVQGIRFGPTGNRIRTTPSLLVKLRGDVALDLRGNTTVANNRLVTTFDEVPDAPVSRFDIKINGGGKGILVITRTRSSKINLCTKPHSHRAGIALDGQNGKNANYPTTVKTPCAKTNTAKKAKNK